MISRKSTLLVVLAVLLTVLASGIGAAKIGNLFTYLFGDPPQSSAQIMESIRIPRIVTAIVVGFLMGIAGLIMQRVFANPLAEPTILGTAAASSFGSITAIALGVSLTNLPVIFLAAFLAAVVVSALTVRITAKTQGRGLYLIVAGFALAALLNGLIATLAALNENREIRSVSFWTSGTLAYSKYTNVLLLSVALVGVTTFIIVMRNRLDLLLLSDIQLKLAGYSASRIRIGSLAIVSLAVASVTVSVGVVAFVGLAAPFIARALYGESIKENWFGSGIIGSIILLLSDTVARSVAAPTEIPISVITSLVGAPLLLLLLLRQGARSHD